MGLFGLKSRTLKIPKGHKYKNILINEEDENLLIFFEEKKEGRK